MWMHYHIQLNDMEAPAHNAMVNDIASNCLEFEILVHRPIRGFPFEIKYYSSWLALKIK